MKDSLLKDLFTQFLSSNWDMKGKRLVNCGQSKDNRDYITKDEVFKDRLLNGSHSLILSSSGDLTIDGVKISDTNGILYSPNNAYGSGYSGSKRVVTEDDLINLIPVEGTFTPAITFGGGSTGITYSNRLGRYQIISGFVLFGLIIQLSSKGASAGSVQITGLPFNCQNIALDYAASFMATNLNAIAGGIGCYVANNSTVILPYYLNTGTPSQMTDANFANNSNLWISGMYRKA